jgi:isopentenyl diphosphate isomerase/L-lactate dehydrogenase-like FMN-dependent dehydrogenase
MRTRTIYVGSDPALPFDPGEATLQAMRRFEAQGRKGRREFLSTLAMLAGAVPLAAQELVPRTPRTAFPPQHGPKVMAPVNVHEIAAVAAKNVSKAVYDYASGGSEDDATLLGNLEAFRRTTLRRRVMVDVSKIDTSLEVLGQKLAFPIMLAPASKNRIVPQGDKVAAIGARNANAVYGIVGNAHAFIGDLSKAGQAPMWMASTLGDAAKADAQTWARRNEDAGATWLSVTVDHPYTPNRDVNIRNGFPGYEAGVLRPATPSVTWEYLEWLRSGSKLPLIVKGILNGEDAEAAVKHGAHAIIVSNHGGRAYDGAVPTLVALPECVDAVGGKIPVFIDGGIRRGTDVLKALALGAKAVFIGRPHCWALMAFGAVGVQRVTELLHAELTVAMGLVGAPNLAAIKRSMVRLPWEQGL